MYAKRRSKQVVLPAIIAHENKRELPFKRDLRLQRVMSMQDNSLALSHGHTQKEEEQNRCPNVHYFTWGGVCELFIKVGLCVYQCHCLRVTITDLYLQSCIHHVHDCVHREYVCVSAVRVLCIRLRKQMRTLKKKKYNMNKFNRAEQNTLLICCGKLSSSG